MVLICIFLKTNDARHLFILLLDIWISSFIIKWLFNSLVHFKNWIVCLSSDLWESSLHILDTHPLLEIMFYKYFLPACGLPFHSVNVVFWWLNVLNLNKVEFIHLVFLAGTFCIQRHFCPSHGRDKYFHVFWKPMFYLLYWDLYLMNRFLCMVWDGVQGKCL